jgi:probable rRNA maturation factor
MIHTIIEDPYTTLVAESLLETTALAVISANSDLTECDLTIVIDGDDRLRELNNEYLGIDAPTDVLSFLSEEEEVDPDTGNVYLGDIIISYPRAAEQASANGHAVEGEIALLVVHGTLHLLGFDHGEAQEKEMMWAAQRAALDSLGIQLNRYPE